MVTDWGRLVRERVRASSSCPPDEGTAFDAVLSLINDGFGMSERDGKLTVSHHEGRKLTDEQRGRVAREKDMLLVLVRRFPEYDFPIDWLQEWKLEVDTLIRQAAATLPGQARDEILDLSKRVVHDEDGWTSLAWEIMEVQHRLRAGYPDRKLPERETLVPWSGWMRVGGTEGEWERPEGVESDDWDECWKMLLKVEAGGDRVERIVMPYQRHPDGRKKPR